MGWGGKTRLFDVPVTEVNGEISALGNTCVQGGMEGRRDFLHWATQCEIGQEQTGTEYPQNSMEIWQHISPTSHH